MGKSSGGGTTTQKSKPLLVNQVGQAADYATDLYKKGTPAYFPGSTVADQSAATTAALDAITARANGGAGNGLTDAAAQQYLKTINGDYLNNNPYIDDVIAANTRNYTDNFLNSTLSNLQGSFAQNGRYGSGAQDQVVGTAVGKAAQAISDSANNLRYQNYTDERARQLAAAQGAGAVNQNTYQDAQALAGVGAQRDAYAQAQLQDQIDRYNYDANSEATNLDNYIARIMQLNGNYGTTTQNKSNTSNGVLSTIGGLAGLAGTAASLGQLGLFGGTASSLSPLEQTAFNLNNSGNGNLAYRLLEAGG